MPRPAQGNHTQAQLGVVRSLPRRVNPERNGHAPENLTFPNSDQGHNIKMLEKQLWPLYYLVNARPVRKGSRAKRILHRV